MPTFTVLEDDSESSISTTATEGNRPGPGRTLGLLFDSLGQTIEGGYNRLRRGKEKGRRHSIESQASVPVEFELPPLGHEHGRSTSTLSSTATAPNLPGPGRTLGLAIDSVGERIGKGINQFAVRRGYGPQETFAQIQALLQCARDEEGRLLHGTLEMVLERRLVRELMRRLLHHTRSDILSTQLEAMDAIISLSLAHHLIRNCLEALGATQALGDVSHDAVKWHRRDRDPLLAHSYKALICLTEVEVHSVASEMGYRSRKWVEEERAINRLLDLCCDHTVAFLAIRYLQRALPMRGGVLYPYTYARSSKFLATMGLLVSKPDGPGVEWESIDVLLSKVIADYAQMYNPISQLDGSHMIWFRLLDHLFRNSPDKLPLTLKTLSEGVVINHIRSKDELLRSAMYINLIRGASTLGGAAPSSSGVCGKDVHNLALVYGRNAAFEDLWSRMSDGLDVLLSSIIALRESSKGDHSAEIDSVCESKQMFRLFARLVRYTLRPEFTSYQKALQYIRFIAGLDRYCWRMMSNALVRAFASSTQATQDTRGDYLAAATRDIWSISMNGRMNGWQNLKSRFADTSERKTFYRHTSKRTGLLHVRQGVPFTMEDPCRTCLADDSWNEWIDDELSVASKLIAPEGSLLWLNVQHDATMKRLPGAVEHFTVGSHHPVFAGVEKNTGKPVFVADCMHQQDSVDDYETCCVAEGARSILYFDTERREVRRSVGRFRVLVLAFDLPEHCDEERLRSLEVRWQNWCRCGLHVVNVPAVDTGSWACIISSCPIIR